MIRHLGCILFFLILFCSFVLCSGCNTGSEQGIAGHEIAASGNKSVSGSLTITGKWRIDEQTIVEIIQLENDSLTIRQISANNTQEKTANGKEIGFLSAVSSNKWQGRVLDTKDNNWYQARFGLQKDDRLLVTVKRGLFTFTDRWEKIK